VLDVLEAMFFTLVEATDDIVLSEELEVEGFLVRLPSLSVSSDLKPLDIFFLGMGDEKAVDGASST
jgi:hypothetical protein